MASIATGDLAAAEEQKPEGPEYLAFQARAWCMGISALEYGVEPIHTSAPLTLELDAKTHLTIPPHLAQQAVVEIQRADLGPGLEEAVTVGIDAQTEDSIHQAYALVYAREDDRLVLQSELPLREHFECFEKAWVNQDEPVLIINGASGNHFLDLWVYRFGPTGPELLFANGSAAGAEFRHSATTTVPAIWIAVEDWTDPNWNFAGSERRWNVYTWDGRAFVYNERRSSAREMGPEERLLFYTLAITKKMDSIKAQWGPRIQDALSKAPSSQQADASPTSP